MSQNHHQYHIVVATRSKTVSKPWVVLPVPYKNKHTPSYMYTPVFHWYHTVILLSYVGFVGLDKRNTYSWCDIKPVLIVDATEVSQYHQHKNKYHMGWVVAWSIKYKFNLISQMTDAIGLAVGWCVINNFHKRGTQISYYCVELMWINLIVYIILVQQWVTGENARPSSGNMRPKKSGFYFRGNEDLSQKYSHVWHVGVGENLFHHPSIFWRRWWHSRFQISHETSDILLTCTWVSRCVDGSTCSESLSESLPERMCNLLPRTSARAQTCVRGSGGLPACHGSESTRKEPRPE